jgi:hypothetical protein
MMRREVVAMIFRSSMRFRQIDCVQWLGVGSNDDAQLALEFPALVEEGKDIGSQGFGHLG